MSSITKYNALNEDLYGLVNSFHDFFWKDPIFQLERNWRPTDIQETADNYVVEIELPRFKKEEIKVEAIKNTLTVTAKNQRSTFSRSLSLADSDLEHTDVKLENGVLTILVPKFPSAKTKVIQVK